VSKPEFSFVVLISCYMYFLLEDACLFSVVFDLVFVCGVIVVSSVVGASVVI